MGAMTERIGKWALAMGVLPVVLLMTGCSGMTPNAAPITVQVPAMRARVMGGQQPVSGASIYFYAANTTAYAGTNTNILSAPVTTNSDGSFSTGAFSCTAGQQMYLVAVGGNPGNGTNAQMALMAALGDCANLSSYTFFNINEVTTVASVFALAPFMSSYTNIGADAGNTAGLARAFNSVNKLANVGTGNAGGPSLASGATAPLTEINALANIIASCVNSTGGVAGDNSTPCGYLFSYATPSGGTAPTNTIALALAIAQNPTLNVSLIFPYNTQVAPFQPSLTLAPTDFTLAISYPAPGSPKSTTVDASGQIWIANSTANSVTVLNQSGTTVQTLTGNGLNAPSAIAMDASGDAWVANSGGTTVSAFTSTGGTFGSSPNSSPFTVGTGPVALAFDKSGDLWVSNGGSNNVSELSSTGALLQTVSTGVTAPGAIAINPK